MVDTCVRCGREGRYAGSWICLDCYRDPARIVEQRAVEAALWSDHRAMRRMLVEQYGWKGSWGRGTNA